MFNGWEIFYRKLNDKVVAVGCVCAVNPLGHLVARASRVNSVNWIMRVYVRRSTSLITVYMYISHVSL